MKSLVKAGVFGLFFALVCCLPVVAQTAPVMGQKGTSEIALDSMSGISDLFMKNLTTTETLGKPFEAGDYTIIPVVCKGIGFGLGTKLDDDTKVGPQPEGKVNSKEQDRLGLGAGGFVKPVALIMINKNGEFKVVKLCEGMFAQLAKYMLPAIGTLVRKTIVTLSGEKMKHDKVRAQMKMNKEKKPEMGREGPPPVPPIEPKAP